MRQVTRRIPTAWNQALLPLWSRRMHDWPNTKYFALPMDYNGYVRLNLKGREQQGCVDPGDADDRTAGFAPARLQTFYAKFQNSAPVREVHASCAREGSSAGLSAVSNASPGT